MRDALLRYRVMANVVGVVLVVLVAVAMPLKYAGDEPALAEVVAPAHGFFYAVFAVVALLLGLQRGWSPLKVVGVMLAGTVPFLSFWVERRIAREAAVEEAAARGPVTPRRGSAPSS